MSTTARHRPAEPRHRGLRRAGSVLGFPRWVLGAAAGTVALAAAVWFLPDDSDVTRGVDPAAGPASEAEAPDLPLTGDPAPPVQESIEPDRGLPADSGTGRRVVYSERRQKVWLVGSDESIEAAYKVSGSTYDNLEPGTYEVYSRSESATGTDQTSTMRYFVRFTQGPTGAAIGFHDIPVGIADGEPVQTEGQLGTPLSQGCVRQRTEDARRLWEFAPRGTTVVVTR